MSVGPQSEVRDPHVRIYFDIHAYASVVAETSLLTSHDCLIPVSLLLVWGCPPRLTHRPVVHRRVAGATSYVAVSSGRVVALALRWCRLYRARMQSCQPGC